MELDTRLQHPLTMMVSGQTGSGKTVWTRNFLQHFSQLTTFSRPTTRVLWVYGQYQPVYNQTLQNTEITYTEAFPNETDLTAAPPDVIVVDDLMTKVAEDVRLADMFTKLSHHLNITVIFIVQNLFYRGKYMRTISLNCHVMVLMKNIRDAAQMYALGRQIFPGNQSYFKDALDDALQVTKVRKYPYLVLNVQPGSDEKTRLMTDIFPFESTNGITSQPIVYLKP